MKLNDVLNGIKNGAEFNNNYFAIAVRIEDAPTLEVITNHYATVDEKIEYIRNTYDSNCKHKNANIVIEDFAVGKTFDDIEINLCLREVSF